MFTHSKGNKATRVAVLLALAAACTSVARAAPGDCEAELNAVAVAVEDPVFLGPNAATAESNLLAKQAAATAKVGLDKFPDAVDKLQDLSDTATAFAIASKPKLADASGINAAVSTAIMCVAGLQGT